jgi:hypothetical protein
VTVDVRTEIDIRRSRAEVAGFASDPLNHFLGRKLAYTYVIREYVVGTRLVMATSDGPFAMETTYEWTDTARASPQIQSLPSRRIVQSQPSRRSRGPSRSGSTKFLITRNVLPSRSRRSTTSSRPSR